MFLFRKLIENKKYYKFELKIIIIIEKINILYI